VRIAAWQNDHWLKSGNEMHLDDGHDIKVLSGRLALIPDGEVEQPDISNQRPRAAAHRRQTVATRAMRQPERTAETPI